MNQYDPNDLTISLAELQETPQADRLLVDIRPQDAYQCGHLPGAVQVDFADIMQGKAVLPKEKELVLYCIRGEVSLPAAQMLCKQGYRARHLQGGYGAWLLQHLAAQQQSEERRDKIEQSLRKKFHQDLFTPFAKAIVRYELVQPGDRIAVCISGGKDSMLMAKLFQELKRHNKFPFELVFLVMDPGYSDTNRRVIEQNAQLLGVPVTIFETSIFDAVYKIEKSPCYLCARMRRGYLYKKAQELGCNKIALGHHYDDVIETTLMGMLYGGQVQTMMPKLHSTNHPGMQLIRPMYLIREKEIIHWRDYNGLNLIQCACKFTDSCTTCRTDGSTGSKRQEIKQLIYSLKQTNPGIEANIFKSMENVSLDTVLAYKTGGVKHSFLDAYDAKGTAQTPPDAQEGAAE